MSQATQVFELDARAATALATRLRTELPGAEWREAPHARYWVRHDGLVLTVYTSGKAVLQGNATKIAEFAARFLAEASAASTKPTDEPGFTQPTLGSDEAGKGDYFGPLVVAAVLATPDDLEFLRSIHVADSKTLADTKMQVQAGQIERELDHEIVRLMPPEYNQRIAQGNGLNALLADLHAQALGALAGRHPEAMITVVDKFADARVLEAAIARRGVRVPGLLQRTGGEAHPVVAAASILARVHFLAGLRQCSDECATELHKGAGAPVDAVANRVVEIGGKQLLAKVAKLHFKNTQRVKGLTG